ncbi:MAG: DUF6629 family protein [Cyanobium sp.]
MLEQAPSPEGLFAGRRRGGLLFDSSALGFGISSFEAQPICFSSPASFTAAALLLPLGSLAIQQTRRRHRPELLPLACMPVLFALQQAIEGLIWLQLESGSAPAAVRPLALAYLFFAFALWPSWIPWVALVIARGRLSPLRQKLLRAFCLSGLLMGLALWLPLLIEPDRLTTTVAGHSIAYSARLLFNNGLGEIGRGLYVALITLPWLLIPSQRLRLFTLALLASGLVADWLARHAFTSVWCFFSALLSGLILWLVRREPAIQLAPQP